MLLKGFMSARSHRVHTQNFNEECNIVLLVKGKLLI